jgi:hypothetical protein
MSASQRGAQQDGKAHYSSGVEPDAEEYHILHFVEQHKLIKGKWSPAIVGRFYSGPQAAIMSKTWQRNFITQTFPLLFFAPNHIYQFNNIITFQY